VPLTQVDLEYFAIFGQPENCCGIAPEYMALDCHRNQIEVI